jgi:hypothetical protein
LNVKLGSKTVKPSDKVRRGYGRHLRTTTRKSIVIPPTGIGEDSGNKASLEALDPTASLRTLRGRFAAASEHGHAFAGGPLHPLLQSGHARSIGQTL